MGFQEREVVRQYDGWPIFRCNYRGLYPQYAITYLCANNPVAPPRFRTSAAVQLVDVVCTASGRITNDQS